MYRGETPMLNGLDSEKKHPSTLLRDTPFPHTKILNNTTMIMMRRCYMYRVCTNQCALLELNI